MMHQRILCLFALMLCCGLRAEADPLIWAPPAGGAQFRSVYTDAQYAKRRYELREKLAELIAKRAKFPALGHRVVYVKFEGQADKLKIEPGDILTGLNGKPLAKIEDLKAGELTSDRKLELFSAQGMRTVSLEPGKLGTTTVAFNRDNPFELDADLKDPRWSDELSVLNHFYVSDADMAEAALQRALQAGLPRSPAVLKLGVMMAMRQLRYADGMAFATELLQKMPGDRFARLTLIKAALMDYKFEVARDQLQKTLNTEAAEPEDNQRVEQLTAFIAAHRALSDDKRLAPPPSTQTKNLIEDEIFARLDPRTDDPEMKDIVADAQRNLLYTRGYGLSAKSGYYAFLDYGPGVQNISVTFQMKVESTDKNKSRWNRIARIGLRDDGSGEATPPRIKRAYSWSLNLDREMSIETLHPNPGMRTMVDETAPDVAGGAGYHTVRIVALDGRIEHFIDGRRVWYAPVLGNNPRFGLLVSVSGARCDIRNLTVNELLTPAEWKARVVPEINKQFKHGYTRLHAAAQLKNTAAAQRLLADGAQADILDQEEMTALDHAVGLKNQAMIELLKPVTKQRLFWEIAFGSVETVSGLLKDLKTAPKMNARLSALHIAALYKRAEMVKPIVAQGVDVNQKVWPELGHATALTLAVEAHDVEMVKALLQHGADPTIANGGSQDPLKIARAKKFDDLVALLKPAVDAFKKKPKPDPSKPVKPPTATDDQF